MRFSSEVDGIIVVCECCEEVQDLRDCFPERKRVVALICEVAAWFEDCVVGGRCGE